jgi:acyl-CoA synthetase (AMP-forming)/AMP-acid ligase II
VLGVPDDRYGEVVVALVQAQDGAHLDETDLTTWCRTRISGYKRPKRFFTVASLDRSAAGKADYQRLRALAVDFMAASADLPGV